MNTFAAKMDAYMDEYCRLYKISGVLRVTLKDEIIYERYMGLADEEHRIPVTRDSVFTLYSMSKQLCAIGLMKLVDRGLVSLSDHPGKYVPEAAGFHPELTLYHMLHHISGLPDFTDYPELMRRYGAEKPFSLRGMIAEMAEVCEKNAPGGDRYANINFAIPALIIENVSGMSYPDYMKTEVFGPLGMKNAVIDRNGLIIPNRVRGYEVNGRDCERVMIDLSYMLGAGDAAATVDDVYCLNLAIKERRLLSAESWDAILTPVPGGNFGKGCTVSDWHGKLRITHNGGHLGFRTLHIQLPEDDLDVILLSNSGYGNSRYSLSEAVHTAFYGTDTDAGEMTDMDAGYIRAQAQEGFDYEGFLPRIPDRVPLTPEQESKVLGDHGYFFMEKDGEDYCLVMRYWQKLYCRHVGGGRFMNTVIDEQYGIEIG